MKYLLVFVAFLSFSGSFAQVNVVAQNGIESLVRGQGGLKKGEINPMIDGYRVQIFFDINRDLINDKRAQFFSRYPNIDTYTTYKAPNFFLRVGDFRTELEAKKLHSEILDLFPTSFILKERVNLPRLGKKREDD